MIYCLVSVQFCLYLDTIVIRNKILPNHQKVSDCPSNNAQKISATIFLATCEWIRLNIETLPGTEERLYFWLGTPFFLLLEFIFSQKTIN